MKATSNAQSRSRRGRLITLAAAAVLLAALPGCFSRAKGKASGLTCKAGLGVMDDKPDAGVNLKVTVTNVGEAGSIKISPEISTSEGEWSRSQSLQFGKGEVKNLTYFFHEPTINVDVDNIQCRVGVSPMAD